MSGYVARKMAGKKAEGMLAPLLESDDEDSSVGSEDSDASSEMETVKKSPMQKLKTLVAYVVMGVGAAASAGAMFLAPEIAIFVMGGICIANVPYSLFKESKIGKLPSLRAMNNQMREDANQLEEQVDVLSGEIDALEPEADRAAQVEQKLKGIAEKQNVNVNKLVELVKENAEILVHMRENLRQRIVQDVIAIVIRSDTDNDNDIDKNEAKALALRIRFCLQEYGVQLDVTKFLKVIGEDEPTVQTVIGLVQKLFPHPNDRKDDDDDSDSDDSEELDDMYHMFHIDKDHPNASMTGAGAGVGGPVSLVATEKKKKRKNMSRSALIKMENRGEESDDSSNDY